MKFMISYDYRRDGLTFEQNVANSQTVTKAYAKWSPADEGFKLLLFVARVSGEGGFMLIETDDAKAIYAFVAKYASWFSCRVEPVLDASESVPIGMASLAWATASAAG
jgi:hypothetical protein